VPTETKPANHPGELQERLGTLEQQRRQAADAITLVEQPTEEIAARQREIAVAVVSEDPEAVAENEQLGEALLIERRRVATANRAAQQLDALIAGAKEDLAADKRRGHLEAAWHLAHERYDLEAQAEQEIRLLLKTLSELEHLDRRHCQELRAGGLQTPTEPLGWMVEAWVTYAACRVAQ
jgi:uncharacterized membrane protein YccC